MLLGTLGAMQVEVRAVVRAHNLARDDDSFEIDPGEIVRAERDARKRGLDLVGFWHSHPRGGTAPSAHDDRGAWPGLACVLVSLRGRARLSAWRSAGGRLEGIELVAPREG